MSQILKLVVDVATISVPLIAIVALRFTRRQIKESSRATQRATAYQIYHRYILLAIEHPVLAYPRMEQILGDRKLYDTYRWFVASMLLSFEEILEACPGEPDWEQTIVDQLAQHKWHLRTSRSVQRHWKPSLRAKIEKALKQDVGVRDAALSPKTITFYRAH